MLDEHDRDLDLDKQERRTGLEELQKRLIRCNNEKTQLILNEWMHGVSEGTEHEAQQLLAFFRAWDSAHGSPARSGRYFREDAVKCGLSRTVDLHFSALNMRQKVIGTGPINFIMSVRR